MEKKDDPQKYGIKNKRRGGGARPNFTNNKKGGIGKRRRKQAETNISKKKKDRNKIGGKRGELDLFRSKPLKITRKFLHCRCRGRGTGLDVIGGRERWGKTIP